MAVVRRGVLLWTVLCGLATLSARAADLVEVLTEEGRRQQHHGTIIEETYLAVKLQMQLEGQTVVREFPLERDGRQNVVTLKRDAFPPQFSLAYQRFLNRDYAGAYETFAQSAAGEVREHAWLIPYIRFYAGEAAFREAKYARVEEAGKREWYGRAAEQYGKLLREAPRHRFAPEAALGRAVALMRLGRFDEAGTLLGSVASSDYPSWTKREAEVWSARLLVERGQCREGARRLEGLLERFTKEPPPPVFGLEPAHERRRDLTGTVLLGLGYALQCMKDYAKAEDYFETAGLKSPDEELRAEAWNSRGLCLLGRGETREALFSFLRVVVLHPGIVHEYQRALYYAAKASKQYYGDDKRAKELRRTLLTRFPNSYWAKKLSSEM